MVKKKNTQQQRNTRLKTYNNHSDKKEDEEETGRNGSLPSFNRYLVSTQLGAGQDEINWLAMGSALTGNLQEIKHETK